MKKGKMLKKLAFIMSAVTIISMTGCGNNSESGKATLVTGEGSKITAEPTELTMFFVRSGDSHIEDLEVWQEIAKRTNVSLKTVSSKSTSDATTAFNTLMASGNLPDLIIYDNAKQVYPKYGAEGAFAPMNDLIDQYAPNVKKILEDSEVKTYLTAADGNIYFLAGINPELPAAGWFVRQDWLDKLGMKQPETVEEYHDMLVAFRDKDPNGNGIKDEIPYFSRFPGVDHLVLLFDTITNWEVRDGKVVYGPTTNEYKTAYKNIAKWYAEDLIDKEIYTRGTKSRDKLLGENIGGSTHDWFGSTAQFNITMQDTVPGINLQAITPPNKKEYTRRDRLGMRGVAISSTSEKKEVAMRFLDYMYSEEGVRFMNFGIEGKHYDMEGDYPKFQDWVLHGDKTTIDILDESGACSGFPTILDYRYEEQWTEPSALESVEEYKEYLVPAFPVLVHEGEDEERFNKIMIDVRTYVDEITQKWVFGTESVDEAFDGFLEQLKKLGIDEATQLQQKAYDKYMQTKKEFEVE